MLWVKHTFRCRKYIKNQEGVLVFNYNKNFGSPAIADCSKKSVFLTTKIFWPSKESS